MATPGRDAGSRILQLLLVIALVCVLVRTNPPSEKHLAKVWKVATAEAYDDSAVVFRLIGLPLIEGTDTALKLEVLNLGICSVGYSDGDPSALSFGALSRVVAFAWWK
jgi:hypothetical protein